MPAPLIIDPTKIGKAHADAGLREYLKQIAGPQKTALEKHCQENWRQLAYGALLRGAAKRHRKSKEVKDAALRGAADQETSGL